MRRTGGARDVGEDMRDELWRKCVHFREFILKFEDKKILEFIPFGKMTDPLADVRHGIF